jgi:hypothetical protein
LLDELLNTDVLELMPKIMRYSADYILQNNIIADPRQGVLVAVSIVLASALGVIK